MCPGTKCDSLERHFNGRWRCSWFQIKDPTRREPEGYYRTRSVSLWTWPPNLPASPWVRQLLFTSIYSYRRTTYFGNLWYADINRMYNSFAGKEAIPSVSKVALLSQGKGPGHWRSALPRDTRWRTDLCVSDRCQGWSNSCFPGFVAEAQEQISLNLQISSIPLFTLFVIHSIRKVSLLAMPLGLNYGIRCKNDRRGLWLASGQRLVWSNRCCSLQSTVESLLETCCRPRINTKYTMSRDVPMVN